MGLLLKFGQAVPEIFTFSCSKKGDFCGQKFKGTLQEWYQKQFFMLFCSFLDINPHNFVKNHPIFKNKCLFYAKFYRVLKEILFIWQKCSLWGLGPKNDFWANWAQKTQQAISPEPWVQFSQTRPHFIQNVKSNKMFYQNIRICLQIGVWGPKTGFGLIRPERCTKP